MKKIYFSQAKEEMLKSDFSRNARIGCVVVYHNKVLAKSSNSDKTAPLQKRYNIKRFSEDTNHKVHAEIRCLKKIIDLDIDFSQVEIYTYRELKDGHIALARPCPSCMGLIKDLGIKRLCYSTFDGFAKERISE